MHHKLAHKIRDIRADKTLLFREDLCFAFKPMKMGLRVSHLLEGMHGQSFSSFVESYDRITKTSEQLFRVELTKEEREIDLDKFH